MHARQQRLHAAATRARMHACAPAMLRHAEVLPCVLRGGRRRRRDSIMSQRPYLTHLETAQSLVSQSVECQATGQLYLLCFPLESLTCVQKPTCQRACMPAAAGRCTFGARAQCTVSFQPWCCASLSCASYVRNELRLQRGKDVASVCLDASCADGAGGGRRSSSGSTVVVGNKHKQQWRWHPLACT